MTQFRSNEIQTQNIHLTTRLIRTRFQRRLQAIRGEKENADGFREFVAGCSVCGCERVKILVACEESGVVRRAFAARGHDAWSCDLKPARDGSEHHLQCDVLNVLDDDWDMMIGHPECRFIALCQIWRKSQPGQEWRQQKEDEAIEFFGKLWNAPIPRICLENPMSVASSRVAKKSQTIHPWQFGHGEKKETWLWLKNLPFLRPTKIVEGREERIHRMTPSDTRSRDRSETYSGIAEAMADQWGSLKDHELFQNGFADIQLSVFEQLYANS